jgi:tol-pal system protein YbgF
MSRKHLGAAVAAVCMGMGLLMAGSSAFAQSDKWNALYDRIIRVEHELSDLRNGGAVGQQQPAGGDAAFRLNALEAQVRDLAAQVRELSALVRQREGASDTAPLPRQAAEAPQSHEPDFTQERVPQAEGEDASRFGDQQSPQAADDLEAETGIPFGQKKAPGPKVLGTLRLDQSGNLATDPQQPPSQNQAFQDQGFGQSQNTQDQSFQSRPQDSLGDQAQSGDSGSLLPERVDTATLDGTATGNSAVASSPDKLYESAYDHLLGRRFGPAEAEFKLFIDRYSDNPLAGDAQYWLGETYYVQNDYKQAAQSFLKSYRDYGKGRKAPDSLLKLGLSLNQLGQKPQACSSFAEVAKQFPKAAAVRNQAIKEMQRGGC